MRLTFRETNLADIDRCLEILKDPFPSSKQANTTHPALWKQLMREGRMLSAVVEDESRPQGKQIVAFGMSVFVTDAFAEEVCAGSFPYYSFCLVQMLLRKDGSTILNPADIRRANLGHGLNVALFHHGWETEGLKDEEMIAIREKKFESLFSYHIGYNIKLMLGEASDKVEVARAINAGFQLFNDYPDLDHRVQNYCPVPRLPADECLCLLGITRAQSLTSEGGRFASLFLYTPPCFYFTEDQQAILRLAVRHYSDEQIAALLCISKWTVQMRWKTMYERVMEEDYHFFVKGKEKKQRLVNYLIGHPEELRPATQPAVKLDHCPPGPLADARPRRVLSAGEKAAPA